MGRRVRHEPRPDEAHRRAVRRDDREDQGGAVKKDQALLPPAGEGALAVVSQMTSVRLRLPKSAKWNIIRA